MPGVYLAPCQTIYDGDVLPAVNYFRKKLRHRFKYACLTTGGFIRMT